MDIVRTEIPISNDEVKGLCLRYYHENNKNNIKVIGYEVTKMGDSPQGYLGNHQYLNVLVARKSLDGSIEEKVRFFMKSAPLNNSSQMEYVEGFGVFKKETYVYGYVIPRLQDINVRSKYFAPKCFLVKDNVLIFENLAAQGYRLACKKDGLLDYNHLLCALDALANMHAASIVLELRTNKTIPELYKVGIEENSYPTDPKNVRSIVFKKAVAALLELVKLIPKYRDSPDLAKILIRFPQTMEIIFEYCKTSKVWKNVFSHGDLWANNLLFKYSDYEPDGKVYPVECRLVDFQLARYCPPILDVITVLTIPTSSFFRTEYLQTALDSYYSLLGQYLLQNDVSVQEVIPKSEFDVSSEVFRVAGLVESCLFSHLTTLPASVSTQLVQESGNFDEFLMKHRSEVCIKAFESDFTYRERMTDMLSDLIDNHILRGHVEVTRV